MKRLVTQLDMVAPVPRGRATLSAAAFGPIYSEGHPSIREPSVPETYAPRVTSITRPLVWAGAATLAAVGLTGWLWAHYGATVFFETIRAGFAACFG